MEGKHIILIVLSLLTVSGLLWAVIPSEYQQAAVRRIQNQPRVVFVLFDLSGSTRSMRDKYANDFEKILSGIGPGDRLIVDRITDRPIAKATFPVNEEFTKYGILDRRGNPIFEPLNQKEIGVKKEAILKIVNEFISSTQGSDATAIMDSLQLAEQVFTIYTDKQKIMIIFSDMIEINGHYNFELDTLTDAEIAEIITRKKDAGQSPRLNGVKVYVVGAGAGEENSKISSQRLFDIQNFWLAYFAAAGADLTKDRYGAALLEF